ncbi:hypothetical protein RCJ96_25880 [Bacillus sp. BSL6]|uniref:hypothetical protein n=1 Tax=Bacillus TaxID=1386 RepID=UPI003A7FB81B
MSKKYTEEEIKEYVENNSNCKFNGTYQKVTTSNRRKILQLTCGCGKEFEVEWVKFNRTDGKYQRQCRKCGHALRGKAQRMTNEEYIKRKAENGITIEHLEIPIGRNKGIKHRCPVCGDEDWKPTPANILAKHSTKCANCHLESIGGHNKSDEASYQLKKLQKGIDIINTEPYIDTATKINHICPVCEKDWKASPSQILNRELNMCEPCGYIERGRDRVHSPSEVQRIVTGMGAEWIKGEYTGKNSLLTFKCSCGDLFEKTFSDFRYGWTRCRKCTMSISTGENEIIRWLDTNLIKYTYQRKFEELKGKRNMPLSYDFSIDDENGEPITLIEYDGEHHFKPMYYRYPTEQEAVEQFELVKKYDEKKSEFAKKKGIPLIRLSSKQYQKLDTLLKHLI